MKTNFHYVYILRSENHPGRYYTGFTDDLELIEEKKETTEDTK
jgi:predicted GIY-YIG superfamily endonuclease